MAAPVLSLTKSFLLIFEERRKQITDDAAGAGFDLDRYRHAR